MDSLPEGVRAVWTVSYYDSIMGNGGLGFVLQPGEPTAEHILEGLRFVGGTEHVALLAEAMDVWARNVTSLTPYYVEKEFLGFHPILKTGVFRALHERYWGLPKLDSILLQVVRANPERFCSP